MVDWAGDEEKVSPASRVFESTCAESRLPCHFKRAKGHPAKLSSMLQASGQSAIRLENVLFCADVAARCWTLDTEHGTCWTKRGSLRSSPRDDQANRRQKRKKKKRNKRAKRAWLAVAGCPPRPDASPGPGPHSPHNSLFGSRQGAAGSSVRMTGETGCPLAGSGEVGVVGRDSGGQSLFLPDERLRGRGQALQLPSWTSCPVSYRASHPVPLRGLPQMCDRRCAPSSSLSLNKGVSRWQALFVRKGR